MGVDLCVTDRLDSDIVKVLVLFSPLSSSVTLSAVDSTTMQGAGTRNDKSAGDFSHDVSRSSL